MTNKFLLVLVLSALLVALPSCRKDDIPWKDDESDKSEVQTPSDGSSQTDDQGQGNSDGNIVGEIVAGKGDETLFTDVQAWNGTRAQDTAAASDYAENEDIYWEYNDWDDVVTVIYNGSEVSVTRTNASILTYASGANVTVDLETNSVNHTVIIVKGRSSDGSLKVYGNKKFKLTLCGLDLTSASGPAINIQDHKRCFVHLVQGSTNRLSDASSYSDDSYYLPGSTATVEDRKAAFFSEGNLIFSGNGCMVVNGKYKHGLCTDGYLYVRPGVTIAVESSAGNCIHTKGDTDEQFGVTMAGGCLYARAASADTKCLKSDMHINLLSGTVDFAASGAGSKCIKAGDDENPGMNMVIGKDGKGPDIKAVTTGSSYNVASAAGVASATGAVQTSATNEASASATGAAQVSATGAAQASAGAVVAKGPGGGGFPGGGGWPGGGGSSGTSAKSIKATGSFTMNGGNLYVSTASNGAEGIESKLSSSNSIVFNGGTTYIQAYDDAINSAGQIVFNDGYVYAYATNNDCVDSNYGRSGSIVFNGGYVVAFGSSSPEEAFDCDNHAYISVNGGTVIGVGGTQGGGSSTPSHNVPIVYSSASLSVSSGYLVLTDNSGKVLACAKVPRSVSSSGTLLVAPSMTKGTSYKYGTVASLPTGSASLWGTYLYTGGTASASKTASAI